MFHREPALIIGLVKAGIALLVAFGLSLTAEQVGAIMAFVTMAGAVVTRSQVWSVESHKNALAQVVRAVDRQS